MASGESHIDVHTHCAIMKQRTWPPVPCSLCHFQIFDKIDSFPKNFLNVFRIKKTNCIFEELSNLYLTVLLISFFPLLLWIAAENRTKLKNYLIKLENQAERNTTNIQTAPDYSSATAVMLVIVWTEHDFCIISDCSNSFKNKLKNLWTSKKFI